MTVAVRKAFDLAFNTKQLGDESVIISGYANKAIADDIGDLVVPQGMDTSRFDKNGMLLFNHDMDRPVGEVMSVQKRDDGLFVEARISNSDSTETIRMVRDLVKENILKTFSIGFDPGEEVKENGLNVIKTGKLIEVSIVTIPMNEDSLFQQRSKRLAKAWDSRRVKEVKNVLLEQKGAFLAAAIQRRIEDLVETEDETKEQLVDKIVSESGMSEDEIKEIMTSDKLASDSFLEAAALVLDMELEALRKLNDSDSQEDDDDENDESEEKGGRRKEDEDDGETSGDSDDDGESDSKEGLDGEDSDDEESDDSENKRSPQPEPDAEELAKSQFQSCVAGKIPKFTEEGMSQEEAVARALKECEESSKCRIVLSKEEKQTEVPAVGIGNEVPKTENEPNEKMDMMVSLLGAMLQEAKATRETMERMMGMMEQRADVANDSQMGVNSTQQLQQSDDSEEKLYHGYEERIKKLEANLREDV